MTDPRRVFGTSGESVAAAYLTARGLVVSARQVRTPFGEIDLVCFDAGEVVFVEVKTRRTKTYGPPEAAVTRAKFNSMRKSAEFELERLQKAEGPWRIDVVAVDWPEGGEPAVTHFPAIDSPSQNW